MKKIFTLFAVAMMATASAFADGFTIGDLGNQKQVRFRSYWVNTKYLGVSGNNLVATTTATTEFILVEAETTGTYYLYDAVNDKFVGKTPSAESAAVPCTSNLADAGVYTFATNSVTDGSHDNSIDRIRINCVNPQISADPTLHYAGTGDNVICYQNQEWGGNAWQIINVTTPSDADWQEAYNKVYPTLVGPTAEEISELQEKISNVYAACTTPGVNRVGYPNATNNSATISALYLYTNNFENSITASNYDAALAALNAVYALTDVYLPEDGKAYTIKAKFQDGNYKYIVNGDDNLLKHSDTPDTKWAAKKTSANTVVFADMETGKYFYVESQDHKNASKDKTVYDAERAQLTIAKVNPTHGQDYANVTAEDLFGCLTIKAKSARDEAHTFPLLAGEDGVFRNGSDNQYYYDYNADSWSHTYRSCEFIIEEVENTNKVKLTNPKPEGTSGLDNRYVGTFSAPYAVELPSGVKAYTAAVEGNSVTLNEFGTNVPANTGVLLYAEEAGAAINVNAVPAAAVVSAAGDNAFQPTDGGDVPEGSYILANGTNGVGFYLIGADRTVAKNKAYLTVASGSNSLKVRFDFEETTGIDAVENASENVVYDLAGRRISNAKSGLYIVNGKKVIR